MSKRKDSPIFRMVVEPGALVPADAYTQERLDTYRHHTVVNVRMTQDIDPPLMRKYWSILSLCVKQCRTPWRSADEASDAIKRSFGVVRKQRSASGAEVEEVDSLTSLEGPAFEDFFEGAMALLYRITGVDPETLWKETPNADMDSPSTHSPVPDPLVPTGDSGDDGDHGAVEQAVAAELSESFDAATADRQGDGDGTPEAPPQPTPQPPPSSDTTIVMRHENIQSSSATSRDDGGGGSGGVPHDGPSPSLAGPSPASAPLPSADERFMVNSVEDMSTRELKQEAIKKILDLVQDPLTTDFDKKETLRTAREWWTAKLPGHPQFIRDVFDTAGKVMRKELPRPAAQNFLYGLRDG